MTEETHIVIDTDKSVAPEGFEFTGEYRKPEQGEYFDEGNNVRLCTHYGQYALRYPILKKKRFKPENNEIYYSIGSELTVNQNCWCGCSYEIRLYEAGNCYQTEEDALKAKPGLRDTYMSVHDETD